MKALDLGRRVAAEQHCQLRLRCTDQHAQCRHLGIQCIGLGARAVQIEGARLAFAQAAFHAGRRLTLRSSQGLHDAQPLLGTAQHEVLPAHFARDEQAGPVDASRCGGGIGLRRITRRANAARKVDLPGDIHTGAQHTRVGHALLDRFRNPAFTARCRGLHADRGPQPGGLRLGTHACLTDALHSDGHVLEAKASASTPFPTRVFEELSFGKDHKGGGEMPGLALAPGVLSIPGGLPIKVGDVLVGAIGVSGSTPDNDELCAQAGLDAIKDLLK